MGVHEITKKEDGRQPRRGENPPQPLIQLALLSIALAAILMAAVEIIDADLGRHVAFGRILIADFASVRGLTMGQAPEILHQAYSYWIYQIILAGILDRLGPAAVVLLRIALLAAAFAGAFFLARRQGASPASAVFALALAAFLSHERFLDRPELFSFLYWVAALWILLRHRRDRFVWLLVPLQILWVNTHIWFGLMPAVVAAFLLPDLLARRDAPRRLGSILGAVLVATLLNPHGPAAWKSQLYLVQFLSRNYSLPFQIGEMMSPYSDHQLSPAVWIFRIAMPLVLVAGVLARGRIGWEGVLVLILSAILGARARRGIPLFALSALVFLPLALDELRGRLAPRRRGAVATLIVLIPLVCGLGAVYGALTERSFLALDQDLRIGLRMSPHFSALDASRLLQKERITGPVFHHPLAAGALVLENGTRLSPFLDARWVGTPGTIDAYQRLRTADEASVGAIWREVDARFRFQTVVLDFYEMPALLRYLSLDNPEWATVFVEPTAAVLCKRGGENRDAIRRLEGSLLLSRLGADAGRERELGVEALRFLKSRPPSLLDRVRFPYDAFFRANYAVLLRYRHDAQAAYLDLLRREKGSLHLSRHRIDALNNLFWCLMESRETDAIDALAETLCREPAVPQGQRRSIRLHQARALEAAGRTARAEELARAIVADPTSTPQDRWAAWCRIASLRTRTEDYPGVAEALERAVREMPTSAETYRSLGVVLDLKLDRPEEALRAYAKFEEMGGSEAFIEERIRSLSTRSSP